MGRINNIIILFLVCVCLGTNSMYGQDTTGNDSSAFYKEVKTFTNPVLPGDHPDPTLLKVGDDFYHCGSSFHFTPYLPIYHSRDLVHWEVISRVVSPFKSNWVTDRPAVGIWQGAITYFYGYYWIYFSANGQWFSKADSPYGPWSDAVQVRTNPVTGDLGYDNSIFVDPDNGKPFMLIKNMQKVNRIQALGKDGQLTDTVINLDWINANLRYSWAEGPVMCKRNGFYFYFPAGDVSGGQYVLRTKWLTSDSTRWERLGDFFKAVTDPNVGFKRPNHIAAPVQLSDGSWWTIGQSYEKYDSDDWSGEGRQTSLFPITWDNDRPWGMAPTSKPILKPDLPQSGIAWRSVTSDYFEHDTLGLCWHFLSKKEAARYSLEARKGWLRLLPDSGLTSVMQKETDHYYSVLTRVDLNAGDRSAKAGLYLSNGNQKVFVRLYTGFENTRKIFFQFDSLLQSIPNPWGNRVWLKIERYGHRLTAFCSGDSKSWVQLGKPFQAEDLDKTQPEWNSWVGTSLGLFAEGKQADFDQFVCKDGFSLLPAVGFSNYYGIEKIQRNDTGYVTNTSAYGGWLMISGVDLGQNSHESTGIEMKASADKPGKLEIWLDNLGSGKRIAVIPVSATGKYKWKMFRQQIKSVTGHHDLFIQFSPGSHHTLFVQSIRFVTAK